MKIKEGELISESLSKSLKWMLTGEDFEQVAAQYGRSAGSLRQIAYRSIPVTSGNKPIVIAMVKRAMENAQMVGQTLTSMNHL